MLDNDYEVLHSVAYCTEKNYSQPMTACEEAELRRGLQTNLGTQLVMLLEKMPKDSRMILHSFTKQGDYILLKGGRPYRLGYLIEIVWELRYSYEKIQQDSAFPRKSQL